MKRALVLIIGLIVALVAVALILPGFLDWNQYKGDLTAQVEALTGRPLKVNGNVSLTILPSPTLSAADVQLANVAGGAAKDMATLKSLDVRISLMPLLSGEIQVESVRLVDPVISLEVSAGGKPNWIFDGVGRQAGEPSASGSGSSNAATEFRLDSLLIENGTISFTDAVSGHSERIEKLTAEISARSLQGPFSAKGRVEYMGLPLGFDLASGRLKQNQPTIFNLVLDIADGAAATAFKGRLSALNAEAELSGELEASGKSASELLRRLGPVLALEIAPIAGLAASFELRADVTAIASEASLNNIELKLGETSAAGAVSAVLGKEISVDLALDVSRVDLDFWLKPADGNGAAKGASKSGEAAGKAAASAFAIPADFSATAVVNVDALTFRGRAVRRLEFAAALAGGAVTIQKIAARLPGGATIDTVGTLTSVDGEPKFEGGIKAIANNLRGFLNWAGADVGGIPADRLRSASMSATVRATPQLLEIYGIDLKLDSSRLTGGAAYALRARPAFSVDFEVDQLNLDAYRAASGVEEKSQDDGDSADATGPMADIAVLPSETVELLNSFDTNIKVGVGKLSLNGVGMRGVLFDVGLLGGAITVRELKADDLGGARVAFKGTARDLAAKPAISGDIDVRSDNVSGLARLFDFALPVPAERLGKFSVKGRIDGNTERLGLDVKVIAAQTTTAIKGGLKLIAPATRLDVSLVARNESYANFWRVFDPGFRLAPGGRDGPLRLSGKIEGGLANLGVDLSVALGKAELKAVGKVQPLTGPSYNLALKASHPDAARFLQGLGVDYRPAARKLGGVALSADVAGNAEQARLGNIDGNFGPVAMAGAAVARFGGARVGIEAGLATSEILVDLFIPLSDKPADGGTKAAMAGASKSPTSGSVERWSSERIDLSVLRSADLTLDLESRGIIYGAYRFADPKVKLTVADGVLRIAPLTGKLFGGAVNLTAELRDEQTPSVKIDMDLAGANLRQALTESLNIDAVSGHVKMNAGMSSRGHSRRDMISRLAGTLSFSAENGIARGLDLRALSDRLKSLDRNRDFLNLIQTSFSGGETAFSRMGGDFVIENGVARSSNLAAVMEAGAGSGRAAIDLPRWLIDMSGSFRLTEHPKAPTVGMTLRGPLDNPNRRINSRELEQYLAQRVGGAVIRKLLGKKKLKGLETLLPGSGGTQLQPPSPQGSTDGQLLAPPPKRTGQSQQQSPPRVKAEDILKDILKKLGN